MTYPINLRVKDRDCLVIGGGQVAQRKISTLLSAGGKVTVCSPEVTPLIKEMAAKQLITFKQELFTPGTLGRYFVVICATNDPVVNKAAAQEARAKGALVNVVDAPDLCDFYVPASVTRGDLIITVSTGGKSPAMAKGLREQIELQYGPEYGELLDIIARLRLDTKGMDKTISKHFWQTAFAGEIMDLVKAGQLKQAEEKIRECVS
jgi:precorrin-2 dehydrogenase/sirohydrochlorin ferrochelatase